MEHRCGIRRTLDVGVKVLVQRSQPRFGRIVNASSSGAYIATTLSLPLMTRVKIALGWGGDRRGGRHHIAAYVVRADRRGLGIEWQEFAPPAVLALMDKLEMALQPARQRVPASGKTGGERLLLAHDAAGSAAAKRSAGLEAHA